MKKEDAMNLIEESNKINLRDLVFQNCLTKKELKDIENNDREKLEKEYDKK